MKIKDRPEFVKKPPAFVLHGSEYVSEAVQTMAKRNIGSVIIIDDDLKVCGIVTERDLFRRLLAGGLDQNTTPLSSIMTSDVKTARQDDEVINWLRLMSNERFRHLPVVDDNGRLINVLSQGDFVSYTWPELLFNLRAKASETVRAARAPLPILIGGIMLYSLLIIAILRLV